MRIFKRVAIEANDYSEDINEEIYILNDEGNLIRVEDTVDEGTETGK